MNELTPIAQTIPAQLRGSTCCDQHRQSGGAPLRSHRAIRRRPNPMARQASFSGKVKGGDILGLLPSLLHLASHHSIKLWAGDDRPTIPGSQSSPTSFCRPRHGQRRGHPQSESAADSSDSSYDWARTSRRRLTQRHQKPRF